MDLYYYLMLKDYYFDIDNICTDTMLWEQY